MAAGEIQTSLVSKKQPQKKLSFFSIYFLGINAIVGSGAFSLPQQIYKDSGVMSIFVLLMAAITVSMVALCYADLSSRFSGSGAAWLYSYNAFGKFTGFQIGLFSWFLGCLTLSAEVVALLRTLKPIVPAMKNNVIEVVFPIGLIILLGIINYFGTGMVKWVDNISSAFKIITLVFFLVIGVFFVHTHYFSPFIPATAKSADDVMKDFGAGFSVVFYMFTGFSFIPVAAAQMDNPEKNIPKTLILVMSSVTIIYVLVQAIAIGILGPKITEYTLPIAQAMQSTVGSWAYSIVIVGMIVSIFGVAFAVSFSTPTLAASLADEHHLLPSVLAKTNKYGAPIVAVVVSSLISMVMTSFSYIFLVACIVIVSFIQYVPSILAVMKFKHTKQYPNNGFSLKGGYTIPIIALLISLYLLTNIQMMALLIIIVVFVLGTIVYFVTIKDKEESASVRKQDPLN